MTRRRGRGRGTAGEGHQEGIREEKKCWDLAVSSGEHVFPLRPAKGRLESGRLRGSWACRVGDQGWPGVEAIFFSSHEAWSQGNQSCILSRAVVTVNEQHANNV